MPHVQKAWVSRPVGGIPTSADLAPSIVFAVLYALLLSYIVYNYFFTKPRAWNVIQISTVIFVMERVACCIIRAVQAAYPKKRASGALMSYVQAAIGLGFVWISADLIKLLRSTLVNTTLPENGASKDRRVARKCYRYFCFFYELAFLGSIIPGTIACGNYSSARFNQAKADRSMDQLIASTAVALGLQALTVLISLVAAFTIKEIDRMRCFELAGLTLLIMPVPIYRLCILGIRTIDVFIPLAPSARTLFYTIHLAPEWICVSILLGTNVRTRFGTGKWGDYELREKKRDKRLRKTEEEAKQLRLINLANGSETAV
ncbi:hypothetical protein RSOLAG22IIIB_13721 [Rhizoctonia solani]|uniref:Uncharacterized protein n=1 Tax=Rhizoctonia solani TaxID=456999 RepID=A0A0K6FQM9_9AGAM|nr:hypothetical protein RSOLAG22IIIB_13721 [Rhizoctonia solani]